MRTTADYQAMIVNGELYLENNQIMDLAPLAGLTGLVIGDDDQDFTAEVMDRDQAIEVFDLNWIENRELGQTEKLWGL